jgi:hypothetical protein
MVYTGTNLPPHNEESVIHCYVTYKIKKSSVNTLNIYSVAHLQGSVRDSVHINFLKNMSRVPKSVLNQV